MTVRVGRVPYLDYRIVQFSAGLSSTKKIYGFENKHIIKRLAQRFLPADVIFRRKSGFGVPVGQWLKNERGLGRYLEVLRTKECREEVSGIVVVWTN